MEGYIVFTQTSITVSNHSIEGYNVFTQTSITVSNHSMEGYNVFTQTSITVSNHSMEGYIVFTQTAPEQILTFLCKIRSKNITDEDEIPNNLKGTSKM